MPLIYWIIWGVLVLYVLASFIWCTNKPIEQGNKKFAVFGVAVRLITLIWAISIIFQPLNLQVQRFGAVYGLALSLIFTHPGLPEKLQKRLKTPKSG